MKHTSFLSLATILFLVGLYARYTLSLRVLLTKQSLTRLPRSLRSLAMTPTSIVIFCVLLFSGCGPARKPVTDADTTFLSICKNDIGISPQIQTVGNALWIYLPLRTSVVDVKASDKSGPATPPDGKEVLSLLYADTRYANTQFAISYDIGMTKSYGKDYGYTSIYTDEYQRLQRSILSAAQRSYLEAERSKYVAPEFLVLIIADIVRGIEVKTTVYFDDFRKIMAVQPGLSSEEYVSRYLIDLRGDTAIKEDEKGEHLEKKPVAMGDFLARQITNRIEMKYKRSAFPPSENTREELLTIVAQTVGSYPFTDYTAIILTDLGSKTSETISKEHLTPYLEKTKSSEGRFYTIRFMQ